MTNDKNKKVKSSSRSLDYKRMPNGQLVDLSWFNSLIEERLEVCEELRLKNRPLASWVEFIARLSAMASNRCTHPRSVSPICHYYHDLRLSKFDLAGTVPLCTYPTWRHLRQFSPRAFAAILWRYISLAKRIRPQGGFARLTLLDVACIENMITRHQTTDFHVSAHFQPYVVVLSQLRRSGQLRQLTGRQHGAWEQKPMQRSRFKLFFDQYRLLDKRFEKPFNEYISDNTDVKLSTDDLGRSISWQVLGDPHIALACQHDDYLADFDILSTLAEFCDREQIRLIAYPHPRANARIKRLIARKAKLQTDARYSDSIAMVTRYSTLGFQFAVKGGNSIFVNVNEKCIVFDHSNLSIQVTKIDGVQQAIRRVLTEKQEKPIR